MEIQRMNDRTAQMWHLYQERDINMTQIGIIFNLSRERVRQLFVQSNLTERHAKERRERVLQAYKEYMASRLTLTEIARMYQIHGPTLCRIIKELGLKKRPKIINHGTRNAYNYDKCRCEACKKANTLAQRRLRGKTPPSHGVSGYRNYRCRCEICTKAATFQHKQYLQKILERA